MGKIACLLLALHLSAIAFTQIVENDLVLKLKLENLSDSHVVKNILTVADQYVYNNVHRSIPYYIKALELSEDIRFLAGKVEALTSLGEAYAFAGNHTKAVETSLKAFTEAEKLKDNDLISAAHIKLASVYSELGDYEAGIYHCRKYVNNRVPGVEYFAIIGRAFAGLNQLDSALYNAQRAYEKAQEIKLQWGMPYYTLGEIHTKLEHYTLALEYFRTGLLVKPNALDSIVTQIDIAAVFEKIGIKDSVYFHAHKAIQMGNVYGFPARVADACSLLKNVYKRSNQIDSAFLYQELAIAAKDTIFAREKLQRIQNLKFNEQLRQIKIEQAHEEENIIRTRNLQYAALGIGLISFIVIFLLLSNTIVVKETFIKFFGVLALLLVFEFINLFAHPFIADRTHHSPIWMFLIMVGVAALLVPGHHKIEKWVIEKLVAKNRRIRLAAAKKTIADLEGI